MPDGEVFAAADELSWYVIQTEPARERVAARWLCLLGYNTIWLPQYLDRHRVAAGRVVERLRPMIPGYLFISFDIERTQWLSLEDGAGILSVVKRDDRPVSLSAGDIVRLRELADMALAPLPSRQPKRHVPWLEGQRLRVTDGPFQGLEGLYLALARHGITLALDAARGAMRVTIPDALVEAV